MNLLEEMIMFSVTSVSVFSVHWRASWPIRQKLVPYHCGSRPIIRSPAPKNSSLITLIWSCALPPAWSWDNFQWESRFCCFPRGTPMKMDGFGPFPIQNEVERYVFRSCKRENKNRKDREGRFFFSFPYKLYGKYAPTQRYDKPRLRGVQTLLTLQPGR